MEEHEIRNLYQKRKSTRLRLIPPITSYQQIETADNKIKVAKIEVKFNIENYGSAPEKESKIILKIPYILINNYKSNINNLELYNFLNRTENGYEIFSVPTQQTIFPDEILNICKCFIQITFNDIKTIKTLPLNVKLYYSGGEESHEYNLLDIIEVNGNPLSQYEFIDDNW